MSEFESVVADLELDFGSIEAQFYLDQEQKAIGERLRAYGVLDRAYDRAEEYAGEMVSLPGRERCEAGVYRETDHTGREIGGGVQLSAPQVSELGVTRYVVRVPAYTLSEEGGIRPAGGVFDETDPAEMVAAQGDGLVAFAQERGFILTPDLTCLASSASQQGDLVVIPCPPRDAI